MDCGQFLIAVFAALGYIDAFDAGPYPPDWMHHRDVERFLELVGARARELDICEPPAAGDVVLMRYGRTYSHGAILVDERTLIHAHRGRGVTIDDRHEFAERKQRYFTVIGR